MYRLASRLRVLLGKDWTVVQTDRFNPADVNRFTSHFDSGNRRGRIFQLGWKMRTAAL